MIRTATTIRTAFSKLAQNLVLVSLLVLSWTTLSAQDVVEVRSEKTGNILKRRGEIKSWEGGSLTSQLTLSGVSRGAYAIHAHIYADFA